ncbi:MAG: hypothetical protein AB7S44_03210 [Spirochaetales bacterium]
MALERLKDWIHHIRYRSFDKALAMANDIVNADLDESIPDDEKGIDAYCNIPELELYRKPLSENSFEAGFHEEIFDYLHLSKKLAVLMWFERFLANKDDREEAYFLMGEDPNGRLVEVKDGEFIFNIPEYIFFSDDFLPYDYAALIVNMSAQAKLVDRYIKFVNTGKLYEYDERTLSSLKCYAPRPEAYEKAFTYKVKCFGTDKELRPAEEQIVYESKIQTLTEEEKSALLLYLLHPLTRIQKEELKVLDEMAMRNEAYIKKDSLYEKYKKDFDHTIKLEEEFITEQIGNRDRDDAFFELYEKQKSAKATTNNEKDR